jgi:16S rRNA processing protein RimM
MTGPADGGREVPIGFVGKPHGLDGAFFVEKGSEDERRFGVGASLRVEGVPATIVLSRRAGGGRRAIKLDRSVERGQRLTVLRSELPPPDPDHVYVADLIGLPVLDEDGRRVGTVADVLSGVANDNLVLTDGTLVPLIEDAVLELDPVEGRVMLTRPYGDPIP